MTDSLADPEFEKELAMGRLLLEARDLAFQIADACCRFDIETYHYRVVSNSEEWHDLKMLHNADMAPQVARAVRYLTLRGQLERNPAYPNLVRVLQPAAAAGQQQAAEDGQQQEGAPC